MRIVKWELSDENWMRIVRWELDENCQVRIGWELSGENWMRIVRWELDENCRWELQGHFWKSHLLLHENWMRIVDENCKSFLLGIAPVPVKQPWKIWVKCCMKLLNPDDVTTVQQSTTKPCAHFIMSNTVRCRYNAVNFLPNPHKRHPIARPWGRDMGCLLWL